jgi:hypothetical protein
MQTTPKPVEGTVNGDQEQLKQGYVQPGLRPVRMTLFPTLDSLNAVIDLGISQLPINTPNALIGLLMTYHNSLLKQVEESNKHEKTT